MENEILPTEIILSQSRKILATICFDWNPQPGTYVDVEGQTYAVLERQHAYQYRAGKYRLHKISLWVQAATRPTEQSLINGHWVVGNSHCRFNARSELIRCAVNPEGPCAGCHWYEAI
jgi:hypothetical protein